ncbi:hypothetical protein GCM10020295_67600 [Streptomyces cinereospinus]
MRRRSSAPDGPPRAVSSNASGTPKVTTGRSGRNVPEGCPVLQERAGSGGAGARGSGGVAAGGRPVPDGTGRRRRVLSSGLSARFPAGRRPGGGGASGKRAEAGGGGGGQGAVSGRCGPRGPPGTRGPGAAEPAPGDAPPSRSGVAPSFGPFAGLGGRGGRGGIGACCASVLMRPRFLRPVSSHAGRARHAVARVPAGAVRHPARWRAESLPACASLYGLPPPEREPVHEHGASARNIPLPCGIPVWQASFMTARATDRAGYDRATAHLDAPLAIVDLDAFDANADDMARRAGGKPIRVASKSVRCRALLERVLARDGFAGVMAFTLAESLWLARSGFEDVLVAYPSSDRAGLRRTHLRSPAGGRRDGAGRRPRAAGLRRPGARRRP